MHSFRKFRGISLVANGTTVYGVPRVRFPYAPPRSCRGVGRPRHPVTVKITGSNPVRTAKFDVHVCGCQTRWGDSLAWLRHRCMPFAGNSRFVMVIIGSNPILPSICRCSLSGKIVDSYPTVTTSICRHRLQTKYAAVGSIGRPNLW